MPMACNSLRFAETVAKLFGWKSAGPLLPLAGSSSVANVNPLGELGLGPRDELNEPSNPSSEAYSPWYCDGTVRSYC